MATAIVIGLGTTGLNIVEELQQFHYQFTGKNKSDRVEYLFCETNISAQPESTASGKSSIVSVPISLTDMAAKIPALQSQNISHQWIPPANQALADGKGAGGQSAYGRLALWMNWGNVQNAITTAWQNIRGDANTNIFIVGTLTGGTCTGAFIDMAYLARHITRSSKIYGLFLTPGNNHVGIPGGNTILENYLIATTAIKELSKADGSKVYDYIWPGGHHCEDLTYSQPFEQIYFLSSDYITNVANIRSIGELSRVAGLNLCCRILDMDKLTPDGRPINDFSGLIDARMTDVKQNLSDYKFSTFGTTLIHYPKSQLIEYTGLTACEEMLGRWVDPVNYFDKNGTEQHILGNKNRINSVFNKQFEENLLKSMNVIDGLPTAGAETMIKAIAKDVDKIINEGNVENVLFSCFTSNRTDNHYSFVSNNTRIIQDNIISDVFGMVENTMQEYQNLNVVFNALESLSAYITHILQYWMLQYGIDGNPANFNKVLQNNVERINRETVLPKLLLQKQKYLNEQAANLLMLTKMHFGVVILKGVQDAIVAQQSDNLVLRSNKFTLPSLFQIKSLIIRVNEVLRLPDGKTGRDIANRKVALEQEMTSSTHFIAIFNQSKEGDILQIKNRYNTLPLAQKFSPTTLCGGKSIYTYLVDNQSGNSFRIYEDCVTQSVQYVKSQQLVDNNGIVGLIFSLSQRVPQDPQWVGIQHFFNQTQSNIVPFNIPGLIGLRSSVAFQQHRCLHLIYASASIQAIQNCFNHQQVGAHLTSLSPGNQTNCVDLPSLSEALVIYQEYGFKVDERSFNPVTDIAINIPIKNLVNNIPKTRLHSRCPYISPKILDNYLNLIS